MNLRGILATAVMATAPLPLASEEYTQEEIVEIAQDFGMDAAMARAESPAHQPKPDVPVTVWVGADERPAFLDQSRWLAEAWQAEHVVTEGEHHFNVIDALADPGSGLVQRLTRLP